jgi:predicted dehydrogenase
MSEVVRVGVIGCGGISHGHMSNMKLLPQFHLRATMDIVEDAAKSACKEFGADYYTTDLNRVLKDPEIDAVYICTHHNTHVPIGIKAANAGKHIFCEKPLALTIEECDQMVNTVKATGVKFMVGFHLRFAPLCKTAKEIVPKPVMTWGRMIQDRWPDDSWAQDPVEGGGNVLSVGCHTTDMVCWFNPSKPVEVHAEGGTMRHASKNVIDTMVSTIRFENGSVGVTIVADCGPAGLPAIAYELLGEGEGVYVIPRLEFWHNGQKVDINTVGGGGKEYIHENRAFAEYVLHGGPSPVSVEDGRMTTLLILKGFESVRTGKSQEINL